MACELPEAQRALPVLKVLYRNTNHIQQMGGPEPRGAPSCRAGRHRGRRGGSPAPGDAPAGHGGGRAGLRGDRSRAARPGLQRPPARRPGLYRRPSRRARLRSWALLDFTGKEYAHTLLRQSVRFCVTRRATLQRNHVEEALPGAPAQTARARGLASRDPGGPSAGRRLDREDEPDDLYLRRDQAAEAVAEALADGIAPESIGEAISLAANQLVLHDPGRRKADTPAKPIGSVHGDRSASTPAMR